MDAILRGGLLSSSGNHLRLAGARKLKLLVLNAALLEQRRHRSRRRSADIEPVTATVELRHELLGLILVAGIIVAQFFNDAPVARGSGIDRVQSVERSVRPTH